METLIAPIETTDHGPPNTTASMALVYSLILLLIYSVSFVLGQCVRGVHYAGILAIGAVAIIFLVPMAVQPLNWLSIDVIQRASEDTLSVFSCVAFAAGMVAISAVLLGLAGVLLKRGIHVDVDQRTLCWSAVVVLLALVAGVTFPMRTNIPAQQVISLPVGEQGEVSDAAADGNDVLLLLADVLDRGGSRDRKYGLVRVHVGEQTSTVGGPVWFIDSTQERSLSYQADVAWSLENASLAYVVVKRIKPQDGGTDREETHALYTVALDAGQNDPVVQQIELDPVIGTFPRKLTGCVHQQRLYVYCDEYSGSRLLIFSLADPRAPSLARNDFLRYKIDWLWRNASGHYEIPLLPIPDVDEATRLELTYELAANFWALPGDGLLLTSLTDPGSAAVRLVLFETGPAQNNAVPLHPIAQHQRAVLEGWLGSTSGGLYHSDHLVYRFDVAGVSVYQVRDSSRIERVGHYAADGGFTTMVSLPHNRVVLAGKRLHVLDLSEEPSSSDR
jgi:hypothetical protein